MFKKYLFVFAVLFFLKCSFVSGQASCTGSLGQPIVNITFGQGTNPGAPFSVSVPGATTSYNYATPSGNPPQNIVFDGDYALVNQVPGNGAWLSSGTDHTGNPSGYMAFFNSAPTPGEFYRQTVTGLCSGTSYEFAAWILNAINNDILPSAVKPNVTFKIFDPGNLITPLVTFNTGDIPASNTVIWRRFSTVFSTPTGINSVILTLSNNNIGGNNQPGNDLAIDDITFRACGPLTSASFATTGIQSTLSVCNNTTYTLYGTSTAGLNNPVYQWQSSPDGITWTNIAGATSLNYVSPGNTPGSYQFRLVSQEAANAGSAFCKFYSNIITLTVTACTTCTSFFPDAGTDTTFCTDIIPISKTLHATGGTSYSWSPAASLNNPSSPDPVATVSATTKFYVNISGVNGCTGIDSVTIFVKPLPALVVPPNSTICKDSVLLLTASGASSYTWSPASAVQNAASANTIFIGPQTTGITLTGIGTNGCSKSGSFTVNVKPKPPVNTIADTTICIGQNLVLSTTGATTYSWNPALQLSDPFSASPQFFGSPGHQYFVTGTTNGCSSKDSVTVTVNSPLSLLQPPAKSVCYLDSVMLSGNNASNLQYQWFPASTLSDATIVNPIAFPSSTTQYSVKITDQYCNFDSTFIVEVTVFALPDVNAEKSNDVSCLAGFSKLTASGAATYNWTPAASLSNASSATPTATPQQTTMYYVTGTDASGCKNKDSIVIEKDNSAGIFEVPNAFTPNKDQWNNCFKPIIKGTVSDYHFMIFDRWGVKMFETNKINDCWDGVYNSTRAPMANYVYYITGKSECGIVTKKGNMILIR